jgi:hypothetical protein
VDNTRVIATTEGVDITFVSLADYSSLLSSCLK